SQIGVFATHQQRAEILMCEILPRSKTKVRASIVARVLECDFIFPIVKTASRRAGVRRLLLPHLAHPVLEFIRIEIAITVIGEGCERTAREHEQRRISTFCWPRLIPSAGCSAHALDASAAEQAHDIDLVCRLVEYRTAT